MQDLVEGRVGLLTADQLLEGLFGRTHDQVLLVGGPREATIIISRVLALEEQFLRLHPLIGHTFE